MKTFIKLFLIILLSDFIIGIFTSYILQATGSQLLHTVSHFLVYIISLPLVLVDRTLPYYAQVPFWLGLVFVAVNVFFQTLVVYQYKRIF